MIHTPHSDFVFENKDLPERLASYGIEIDVPLTEVYRPIVFANAEELSRDFYRKKAETEIEGDFQKESSLKAEVFKEYYVSRRIHVYANDTENNKHALAVEFALPFLRYLKISFKRPWGHAKWFGMDFWAAHTIGITFSLFKHDLKIIFGKNNLYRTSNLSTEKALDRFLTLNGKRKIPLSDIRGAYCYNKEVYRLFCRKVRERKKTSLNPL